MAVDAHNDRYKPCCLYKADNWPRGQTLQQYWHMLPLQELRKNLLSGVPDPGCQICWNMESVGQISMRQSVNASRKVVAIDRPTIRQVKLITGKTCNLSCMMCFSTVSSSYQSLWNDRPDWQMPDKRRWNLEYDVDMDAYIRDHADQLEFIEVLGGEPLFSKQFLDLVNHLIAIDAAGHLTLYVITNGTIMTTSMMQLFTKFKKTVFVISIDGIGDINDYQRWPSRWSEIDARLALLKDHFDISITPTVTALNILGLPDLYDYCDQQGLHVGAISMVNGWPQLLPKNLPSQLRKKIDSKFSMLAQGEGDPNQLIDFIKAWDRQRGISIVDYMPEWQGLI